VPITSGVRGKAHQRILSTVGLPGAERVVRDDSFTPELLPALSELSEMQRICVVMVHGHGWPATEAAEVLDISVSSVRTHIDRALNALREALEVDHDRV
jgi:DNA-directed RNA polymerase specialized sigma24 family protein